MLPILITLLIAALSVSLVFSSLRLEPARPREFHSQETRTPSKLMMVIGIMIAYAGLMDTMGFLLCSFLAMVLLFLTFGVRDYIKMAVIIIFTLGVLYVTFEKLLMAPLPIGSFIERFLD